MDVMADMLITPTFTDLDREREVILEEIAMVEDSPQDLIHDVLAEVVLDGHPLAHPILGTREEYRRRLRGGYPGLSPPSASASATWWWPPPGNVSHDAVRELLLERQLGSQRRRAQARAGAARVQPCRRFVEKETEQMHVCLGGVGLARDDERRFQLSVLDSLFGGSLSSRLFQEIREKRGLVYSVYSFSSLYQETGPDRRCTSDCRPERLGAVMETVDRELRRLVSEPVPDDELAAGQGAPEGAHDPRPGEYVQPDDPSGQRGAHRHRDLSLDELADRIEAVTPEQVLELASEVYRPEAAVGGGHRRGPVPV